MSPSELGASAGEEPDSRPFLLACALGAVAVAVFVARVPLEGVPHVSDELSYTWQARLFAAGMRTGPAPDFAELWRYPYWWVRAGDALSPFPPGWPLLLSLGERFGLGWLVNPLLFGVLPPLIHRLTRQWTGDAATARLAAVVVALSPGAWLLAATRMSQTSVLVALAVAAVAVSAPPRGKAGSRGLALSAALAVSYVVLARQYDAVLVGGPLLLLGLWRLRDPLARVLLVLLPGLTAAAVLSDNHHLTGEALRFPISGFFADWPGAAERPGCNRLGFGDDVGCHATLGSLGHSPAKALSIGLSSLRRLDGLLLGLPGGLLLACLGAWRLRGRRLLPVLGLSALVLGGYALYWSPGAAYGARFYHPLYLVLPGLLAAGLVPLLRRWAVPLVAVVALAGGSRVLPELADGYFCVDGALGELLAEEGVEEGVIFVHMEGGRSQTWPVMQLQDMACGGIIEATAAVSLDDPSALQGGLQIRQALADLPSTRRYMGDFHPGQPAWLAVRDATARRWTLQPLGVLAD